MKIPARNRKNGGETRNCHESVRTLPLVMVVETYDYGNGVASTLVAVAQLTDRGVELLELGCFLARRASRPRWLSGTRSWGLGV